MSNLSRRWFLGGLVVAPAVVLAQNLMPLRGIKLDPIVKIQSWLPGSQIYGAWEAWQGPLSQLKVARQVMEAGYGASFEVPIDPVVPKCDALYSGEDIHQDMWRPLPNCSPMGFWSAGLKQTKQEREILLPSLSWNPNGLLSSIEYQKRTDEMRKQLAVMAKWGA